MMTRSNNIVVEGVAIVRTDDRVEVSTRINLQGWLSPNANSHGSIVDIRSAIESHLCSSSQEQ